MCWHLKSEAFGNLECRIVLEILWKSDRNKVSECHREAAFHTAEQYFKISNQEKLFQGELIGGEMFVISAVNNITNMVMWPGNLWPDLVPKRAHRWKTFRIWYRENWISCSFIHSIPGDERLPCHRLEALLLFKEKILFEIYLSSCFYRSCWPMSIIYLWTMSCYLEQSQHYGNSNAVVKSGVTY